MDLFGESQAAHALGIEIDYERRTSKSQVTATALVRLSPIAYFYRKSSKDKRREVLADVSKRMFGKVTSLSAAELYIELLVQAFNGESKETIGKSIDRQQLRSNDSLSRIFSQLIDVLRDDENDLQLGIERIVRTIAETKSNDEEQERYLNPFDADQTILLSLYLQLAAAIYNRLPTNVDAEKIYARSTIESLIKWIFYQSETRLTLN